LALLLLLLIARRQQSKPALASGSNSAIAIAKRSDGHGLQPRRSGFSRLPSRGGPPPTDEEIVAAKLNQFSRNRRALVHSLARHAGKQVPKEVEEFFDAVDAGRWEEADALFEALKKSRDSGENSDLYAFWRPIQETQGIQQESRHWPAQQLLDYGERVLGSLDPGMVFIGGTDPGCFINTFLNETSEGEHHITFTQNALADNSYITYLNALYGDRLKLPTPADEDRALQEYTADLQRRMAHDRDLPGEPKQVLPGEELKIVDGKPQVSGQGAVMGINERLLQQVMDQNPDLHFALEESFPLKSTYGDATLLGPVMELRAGNNDALSAEKAANSVSYWRHIASDLPPFPEGSDSYPNRAYAKTAAAQANLLLNHNFTAEAEQTYELALRMYPGSYEAANGLHDVYIRTGRPADAQRVLDEFARKNPGNPIK
jgi:tetratricopeptide (TPR) repeat protein